MVRRTGNNALNNVQQLKGVWWNNVQQLKGICWNNVQQLKGVCWNNDIEHRDNQN